MKQLLFLSAFTFICLTIDAQIAFFKKADARISGTNPGDTVHNRHHLIILNDYAFNYQKGKFLYNTEKGKVYALPPDNMLCLVPGYHSKMRIASSHGAHIEPMPNPMPKREMIPDNNSKSSNK